MQARTFDRSAVATWPLLPPGGLSLYVTTDPDGPVLREFFDAYSAAFILGDERETLEGFRKCLRLCNGHSQKALEQRFGPLLEAMALLRDHEGTLIGGYNISAYTARPPETPESVLTCNLNYIFVAPERRGTGAFRKLLTSLDFMLDAFFDTTDFRPIVFFEQNDPFRMSREAYMRDTQHAGLDQFDRIAIWTRAGARLLDFSYTQPPLSDEQNADPSLALAVLGQKGEGMHPAIVRAHLMRFFAIAVLKGQDPRTIPAAAQQFDLLTKMAADRRLVRLLTANIDTRPMLADPDRPKSIVDALDRAPWA